MFNNNADLHFAHLLRLRLIEDNPELKDKLPVWHLPIVSNMLLFVLQVNDNSSLKCHMNYIKCFRPGPEPRFRSPPTSTSPRGSRSPTWKGTLKKSETLHQPQYFIL